MLPLEVGKRQAESRVTVQNLRDLVNNEVKQNFLGKETRESYPTGTRDVTQSILKIPGPVLVLDVEVIQLQEVTSIYICTESGIKALKFTNDNLECSEQVEDAVHLVNSAIFLPDAPVLQQQLYQSGDSGDKPDRLFVVARVYL